MFTLYNPTYVSHTQAIFLCNSFKRPSGLSQVTHLTYLIFGYLGCVMARTAWHLTVENAVFMLLILTFGNVLKIFYPSIGPHTVFMVYLKSFRPWSDECEHDEMMYHYPLAGLITEQYYTRITLAKVRMPQAAHTISPPIRPFANSLYIPTVAYLVDSFISRYWKPFFFARHMEILAYGKVSA